MGHFLRSKKLRRTVLLHWGLPVTNRAVLIALLVVGSVGLPLCSQSSKSTSAKKTSTAPAKPKAKKKTVVRKKLQQQPTPERYQEIQQALIDKGFLAGPATGKWDAQSADALKRFQADQKLASTGKLDALSLIRLGLGPKRDPIPPSGILVPTESGGAQ
jgi:peptidoglycan hydrolase-like protein with peptidoglycan-binding domain